MSLGEVSAGLSASVNLAIANVARGFAVSRAAGGAALRALGEVVESAGRTVLGKALRIDPKMIGTKVVNGPGGKRVIDFFVRYGDRVATIEAKYKLPRYGSDAFKRLVAQLESAMATPNTGQVVLWTLKTPTNAELAGLLGALGENASVVQVVDGLVGLAGWARFFFLGI